MCKTAPCDHQGQKREGGDSGTSAEIPLWPMERTTVEQLFPCSSWRGKEKKTRNHCVPTISPASSLYQLGLSRGIRTQRVKFSLGEEERKDVILRFIFHYKKFIFSKSSLFLL